MPSAIPGAGLFDVPFPPSTRPRPRRRPGLAPADRLLPADEEGRQALAERACRARHPSSGRSTADAGERLRAVAGSEPAEAPAEQGSGLRLAT
ncbi:MAG: hypothetical protein AAGK32_21785 [Actinomycetota bacterium]